MPTVVPKPSAIRAWLAHAIPPLHDIPATYQLLRHLWRVWTIRSICRIVSGLVGGAVVRLDQVDPVPEDQQHSNQYAVQLGFPSLHCSIAGFPKSIFREALGLHRKPSTIGLAV
jgi:hypothetical protein